MINAVVIVLLVLSSLFLIITILMHSGRGSGLSDMFGGTNTLAGGTSLERTLSRAAILLHDAIPFDRLHVLRLDRTESVTLYVAPASGEVEVTGHLIGDAPSPSADAPDAAERSRLIFIEQDFEHIDKADRIAIRANHR